MIEGQYFVVSIFEFKIKNFSNKFKALLLLTLSNYLKVTFPREKYSKPLFRNSSLIKRPEGSQLRQ